jgi:hypothetical protein
MQTHLACTPATHRQAGLQRHCAGVVDMEQHSTPTQHAGQPTSNTHCPRGWWLGATGVIITYTGVVCCKAAHNGQPRWRLQIKVPCGRESDIRHGPHSTHRDIKARVAGDWLNYSNNNISVKHNNRSKLTTPTTHATHTQQDDTPTAHTWWLLSLTSLSREPTCPLSACAAPWPQSRVSSSSEVEGGWKRGREAGRGGRGGIHSNSQQTLKRYEHTVHWWSQHPGITHPGTSRPSIQAWKHWYDT